MKTCTKCGIAKRLVEFYRRSDSSDGHLSSCRKCEVAAATERKQRRTPRAAKEVRRKFNNRLYGIYYKLKDRCNSPICRSYMHYGGRGITVCEEWGNSYGAFHDWALANGYSDDLEIDRINCNVGYSPSNCRWVTRTQNLMNRRKRRTPTSSRFKGVSRSVRGGSWVAQIHDNKKRIYLGSFKTGLEAAMAYDVAARARQGRFALLNFPERI